MIARIFSKNTFISTFKHITFFDIFFYIFMLCLAKQFTWIFTYQPLAWSLATVLALLLWYLYLLARVRFLPYKSKTEWWFYLLFLPAFLWFIFMAIPDHSFDTLNLRLAYQKLSMTGGYPFNESFSLFLANILPEMINAVFRYIFGMRLGVIVNFILIAWVIYEIKEILSKCLKSKVLMVVVLIVSLYGSVTVAQGLHIYFVDFHVIPIFILMLRLIISDEYNDSIYKLLFLSFLIGLSFAIKYSNLAFIAPVGVVGLFNQRTLIVQKPYVLLSGLVAFIFPNIPFVAFTYSVFGSPLFPLYNEFFKSPYFPEINLKDHRWGPHSFMEALIWPFKIIMQQSVGFSELTLTKFYDGRLTIGYFFGLILIPYTIYRRQYDVLKMIFILLLGTLLWSVSTGYRRYMIAIEYLAIILSFIVLSLTYKDFVLKIYKVFISLALLLSCVVVFNSYMSGKDYNWAWNRLSFTNVKFFQTNYKLFFKDRDLRKFQTPETLEKIASVQNWWFVDLTSYISLLSDKPIFKSIKGDNKLGIAWGVVEYSAPMYCSNLKDFPIHANSDGLKIISIVPVDINYFGAANEKLCLINFVFDGGNREYTPDSLYRIMISSIDAVAAKEEMNNNSEKISFSGWAESEVSQRWSWANTAKMFFKIDDPKIFSGELDLTFTTLRSQTIQLFLNDKLIMSLPKNEYNGKRTIKFNRELLIKGVNELRFELPDATASSDGAPKLAIALNKIEFR